MGIEGSPASLNFLGLWRGLSKVWSEGKMKIGVMIDAAVAGMCRLQM